jgi:hypothetical protein
VYPEGQWATTLRHQGGSPPALVIDRFNQNEANFVQIQGGGLKLH